VPVRSADRDAGLLQDSPDREAVPDDLEIIRDRFAGSHGRAERGGVRSGCCIVWWRLLTRAPIGRRFKVNPVFNSNAATIMTLAALGYNLACLDDLCASAFRAASEFN
jgi:hypothetical protein